jgi:hypothetical protein
LEGFEFFTAVVMKSSIFWDITPRRKLKVNRRFGSSAYYLLHAGFLRALFFDREDGGNMFLGNVSLFSTDYTALYPRRQNSSHPL